MPKYVTIGSLSEVIGEDGVPRGVGQRTMNLVLVQRISVLCEREGLQVAADALRSWLPGNGASPDVAELPAEIERLEARQQELNEQGDTREAAYYEAAAFACRTRLPAPEEIPT